jgi:hypothetical protein
MGWPWDQLVPAAVLRDIPGLGGGALIDFRTGSPRVAVFDRVAAQASAAAFWDALAGQQDRHANNYRYDASTDRLSLIDHAFAFARPGDLCPNAMFLVARRARNQTGLRGHEIAALDALLSGDLHGLRGYLAEERADALEARAERMLRGRCLPLPGRF